MIAWFPGQTLTGLQVKVNEIPVTTVLQATVSPALRRLVLPASSTHRQRVALTYRLQLAEKFRYRFPVAVPSAAGTGTSRVVEVFVSLPPSSIFSGASFPNLTARASPTGAPLLYARLLGVPSVVQVTFSSAPAPWLGFDLALELIVMAIVLLPLTLAALRRWGRG